MKSGFSNIFEIVSVFFRLGLVAFGGPAAHIAMMDAEIVEKRKWLSREHFLDLVGATNLIPGPNSTEMTMHCGYERGGTIGLFAAGISFIFPAVVITGVLAYFYVTYSEIPQIQPLLIGIKPAVIAIIAGAVYKLGKKAVKSVELGILGALVVISSFLPGTNEILILLAAGFVGMFYFTLKTRTASSKNWFVPVLASIGTPIKTIGTTSIFLKFLKVGSILYGSGYVLFAYLDAELVQTGIMTSEELMDAIAVGQFTPGPVLSTATFIGFQIGGWQGALAATAGIFLPSFLFVLLLNPLIPKLRKSKVIGFFLDSVNVASVGIMVAVLISFGIEAAQTWQSILISIAALFFTFGPYKINVMLLVLGSSLLGFALFHLT